MAEEMAVPEDLDVLRKRLDSIDGRLLDTLRERIDCCVEIGLVKRDNAIPMMQEHRINVVQERAARYGERHGISTTFLRQLYDLIIAETCRVEDRVIGEA